MVLLDFAVCVGWDLVFWVFCFFFPLALLHSSWTAGLSISHVYPLILLSGFVYVRFSVQQGGVVML